MPKLTLLQRYAGKQPGETIDIPDEAEAQWLVGIGRATSQKYPAHQQRAVAPGSNGPDPLAGGDPTRRYGHATNRVEHTHNQALPVPGSPVQYNKGVAPTEPPVRPGEATGRQQAKDAARTNRERPAGSPPLEGAAPSAPQVHPDDASKPAPESDRNAPISKTAGKSEDKPAAKGARKS